MIGKSWVQLWRELLDEAVRVAKMDRDVRSAPLNDVADNLRAQVSRLGVSDEGGARALRAMAAPVGDRGPDAHQARDSADAFLRNIYGDRYHTDGSALARAYAHYLASAPETFHRIVATRMRQEPHGGIWLGDSSLLNLGHPAWSAATRGGGPRGWPSGSTWDDVGGAYDFNHRALLLGNNGRHSGSLNRALHEFGHAVDHALGMPSRAPAFGEVHRRVLPLIQRASPENASYFAQPARGELELFAESFAWFHNGGSFSLDSNPTFYHSAAAARHLADYYQRLRSSMGIA